MKTYFRLLSFAKPIEKFAIPYIFYTLLYVLFSSVLYILLPSLLSALFSSAPASTVHALKNVALVAQPKWYEISGWFKYFLNYFINTLVHLVALQFVCSLIIISMLIGNFFKNQTKRTMEN